MSISTSTRPITTPGVGGQPGVRRYVAENGAQAMPKRRSKLVSTVLPTIVSFGIGLILWSLISTFVLADKPFLLPPPWDVVTKSLLVPSHLLPMLRALGLTASVALIGLVIASVLGLTISLAMSQSRLTEKIMYPYAVLLQTIPVLALVPLIGMWFGYSYMSRMVVCIIFALFPMISNPLFGLRSVEPGMQDLFSIRQATRWQRLRLLAVPAALPSIFTGLQQAAGLTVIGAVVGDMYFTQGLPGIGTLLQVYTSRLQSADLFAAIGLASLFGMVVFGFFNWLKTRAVGSWHASSRSLKSE